ncbi:MAG: glucose-1-phosphate thymidylyltransferase [Caldilineales bacterium]|nr:glucose-1-phosphate thymidylyltransferase [Caldilineales bacterium]
MKALILSGGKGSRLYPLTYTNAKQLIPVANKPVLFRVIEAVRDAGITEIGIVIGNDENGRRVQDAVGQGRRWGVDITYIPQDAPLGLAHCVAIAQDFLGSERFVMFLGDNVIEGGISNLIRGFEQSDYDCQIVLKEVEEPQHYGVAELNPDRSIKRLVEKPREPRSNLALVGIYMFNEHVHEAVRQITPSWRGELEITDAIQWLVEQGLNVHPYIHRGWWIDTGKPIDMLAANSKVLEELTPEVQGFVDRSSDVDERVTVEAGAEIVNSVVRGPTIIGENTRIANSYVGPFTSIYHDCVVENAEIEHSLILEHSSIVDVPARITDSLIGRNVELSHSQLKPRALKLTLGDNSRLGLI